ncbi:hypothetical protein H696_04083 [Fonticula alba]|uniref:Uncharacterized protein n=1 Tax=Fonticula alba TaxID=691883 RepID=A0A058Z5V7_FONAL|nr:hypothetical protein H696_04083 [Fonticula alba]KCV69674.1 hypothetical protein H696_04083 [Fonticula alba]|eukprot:XP_009496239.1 hypothetical protein H696_04083 [Fonticula alba]
MSKPSILRSTMAEKWPRELHDQHTEKYCGAGVPGETNQCRQYLAVWPNRGAHVGHFVTNWKHGYAMAVMYNLTFLHSLIMPNQKERTVLDQFLGLGLGEQYRYREICTAGKNGQPCSQFLPCLKVVPLKCPEVEPGVGVNEECDIASQIAQYAGQCNVVFHQPPQPVTMDLSGLRPVLREKWRIARQRHPIQYEFDNSAINVALHVRRGDIVGSAKGAVAAKEEHQSRWTNTSAHRKLIDKLLAELGAILQRIQAQEATSPAPRLEDLLHQALAREGRSTATLPGISTAPVSEDARRDWALSGARPAHKWGTMPEVHVHLFSQGAPADFAVLQSVPHLKLHLNADLLFTISHMAATDVLVMARSGLSDLAAKFRSDDQITIVPTGFWDYAERDWFLFDNDTGDVDFTHLEERLRILIEAKRAGAIPSGVYAAEPTFRAGARMVVTTDGPPAGGGGRKPASGAAPGAAVAAATATTATTTTTTSFSSSAGGDATTPGSQAVRARRSPKSQQGGEGHCNRAGGEHDQPPPTGGDGGSGDGGSGDGGSGDSYVPERMRGRRRRHCRRLLRRFGRGHGGDRQQQPGEEGSPRPEGEEEEEEGPHRPRHGRQPGLFAIAPRRQAVAPSDPWLMKYPADAVAPGAGSITNTAAMSTGEAGWPRSRRRSAAGSTLEASASDDSGGSRDDRSPPPTGGGQGNATGPGGANGDPGSSSLPTFDQCFDSFRAYKPRKLKRLLCRGHEDADLSHSDDGMDDSHGSSDDDDDDDDDDDGYGGRPEAGSLWAGGLGAGLVAEDADRRRPISLSDGSFTTVRDYCLGRPPTGGPLIPEEPSEVPLPPGFKWPQPPPGETPGEEQGPQVLP